MRLDRDLPPELSAAECRAPEGARTLSVTVPYPRPALGPNGRGHWATKARLVAAAREEAGWAAYEALVGRWGEFGWRAHPHPHFPPGATVRVDATVRLGKGRKRMDEDGLWGCLKAALDGLTDAGVWQDDKQAILGTVTYADGRIPGEGEVVLTLSEA
jgi:hypothetical protein